MNNSETPATSGKSMKTYKQKTQKYIIRTAPKNNSKELLIKLRNHKFNSHCIKIIP